MKKFKKGLALSLALAMGLSLCACGGGSDATTAAPAAGGEDTTAPAAGGEDTTAPADATEEAASATMAVPSADGEKISVYSWNTELGGLVDKFKEKYPEFNDLVEYVNLGMEGGSTEYRQAVETAFGGAGSAYPSVAAFDDVPAKYFICSDYAEDLYSIGITDAMYAKAYQYTKDYATVDGQLRAMTWQATPGCLCYRADIAEQVLGSGEPDAVQEYVKDWDAFKATADKMKEAGFKMCSGPDDVKTPYLDAKKQPWVVDDKLNIDSGVIEYMELAKWLYDGDYTNKTSTWSDAWNAAFDKDVFCYFGCTWFVYWCIKAEEHKNDWRVCAGPTAYHWGGTYMVVGKDSPNKELAAFFLYTLCCDQDFMYDYMVSQGGTPDFVNSKEVVEKYVGEGKGAIETLGGQNPFKMWLDAVDKINTATLSEYDAQFNGYMDSALSAYMSGEAADIEAAKEMIKNSVRNEASYITVE